MTEKQQYRLIVGVLLGVIALVFRLPLLWYVVAFVALLDGQFSAAGISVLIAIATHGWALQRKGR